MSSSHPRAGASPDTSRIAAQDAAIPWPSLEDVVHVDPAGRGLASFRRDAAPLDRGHLRAAALHLAAHAASVGIVTGFGVVTDQGVVAETDGPPGALFLARSLAEQGVDVCLVGDRVVMPLLQFGCDHWHLSRAMLVEMPIGSHEVGREWVTEFLSSPRGRQLTHLVSIERPGPSHTLESLAAQSRSNEAPLVRFEAAVPVEHRDVCYNMRGESIDAFTAPAHLLFDAIAERRLPITTIGIGDGGNEIGMGRFEWQTLVEAVGSGVAGRIACRVATDFTIIGGVSDWAAYALALCVARLRGHAERARRWNCETQRDLIEQMIRQTDGVDGLTRRHEPTVDGLPLDVYLRPLEELHRLLGET
jgi:hypothetical protein